MQNSQHTNHTTPSSQSASASEAGVAQDVSRSFLDALALSRDWCSVLDSQGITLYVNPVGLAFLGQTTPLAQSGQAWANLWPKDEQAKVLLSIAAAQAKGQAQFEAICPSPQGSPRCWDVQITAVAATSAEPAILVCMAQDVSELRHAYLQTARQAELLNTALSSGELGHWSHNIDNGDFKCSPCFRQQFGLPESGPVSAQDVFNRITPETLPSFSAARDSALKTGGSHALELHAFDRQGNTRVLMTHFHIDQSPDGQRHVSGVSVDLSNRLDHEDPEAQRDLVARMVRERTQQLSNLHAHMVDTMERDRKQLARELHDEMGSLLTMMSFEISRLREHFKQEADLPPEVTRLDQLVSNLREYKHRVIAGLRPPLLQELGLELALLTFIEQYTQASGMNIDAAIDDALPPLKEAASLAVFRMIQECLTNVGKYAKATSVQIDLTCDATHLVIEVSDNGIGLPPTALSGSRFGLVGMRERMQVFGGTTTFERINEAGGTHITAMLPLNAICEPTA